MGGESSLYFPTGDDNSDDLLRLLEALDSQGVNNSFSSLNVHIFGGSFSTALR